MRDISCIALTMSLCLGLLLTSPLFAIWGSDVMSIDAIKHWNMDNQAVHVRGKVLETLGREGFKLIDDTGEIQVHFTNNDLRHFNFRPGMRVEVRGRIERDNQNWDIQATAVQLLEIAVIGEY